MNDQTQSTHMALCPVCQLPLALRPAQGRKSGKTSLMLICPQDGRHFRGFISDRAFVDRLLARLEGQTPGVEGSGDLDTRSVTNTRSKTNLERASES